jgi:hypothetical protein
MFQQVTPEYEAAVMTVQHERSKKLMVIYLNDDDDSEEQ